MRMRRDIAALGSRLLIGASDLQKTQNQLRGTA